MANLGTQTHETSLLVSLGRYLVAQLLVALSTFVAFWVAYRWGSAAVEMIFLPAVLAAGTWWGFGPAVLAAVTSALSYNFFFTEPLYTLRISSAIDIVNVIILFLVAVVTSQLAASVRRQAQLAEAHATRNATIAGFARRLLSCSSEEEIGESACHELSALFDCNSVMMTGLPHPIVIGKAPRSPALTPTDLAAAVYTLQSGDIAGHGAPTLAPAEWAFYPIRSEGAPLAAMGFSRDDGLMPIDQEQRMLVESLLDQIALALGRSSASNPSSPLRAAVG